MEKNIQLYGRGTPPDYDTSKITNFPITLVCGKQDLLVDSDDYTKVRDELVSLGNDVDFQEYELGHIGLVIPKNNELIDNLVNKIVQVTE
jgi:predicted esterase